MASLAARQLRSDRLRHWLAESTSPLVLPAICLLPLVLTAAFMTEPFERDEGTYAAIAQALQRGDLPYRDVFDHKPPLIYVWYYLSFAVFGESIVAPRLMAALVWSLTAVIVYKQGSVLVSEAVGRTAAFLFALSSGLVLLQANANTEVFMLLPLTLSFYALTRTLQGGGPWWVFLIGVSGSLAVVTKQVAIVNLIGAGLILVVQSFVHGDVRRMLQLMGLLAAGVALVGALTLLPYLLTGSVGDFLYANWTYNRLYGAETSFEQRVDFQIIGDRFFLFVAGPLFLLALLGLVTSLRGHARGGLLLAGWLLVTYGGLLLSGRAFPHYYVALLPPLALLASLFLISWHTYGRTLRLLVPVLGISTLLCLTLNGSVYLQPTPEDKHIARFAHETSSGTSFELASNTYTERDLTRHNDSAALAEFVRSTTSASDTIYNYGRETQLYFYADRRPASRFIYDRPFWLDPPTFQQAMDDLQTNKPLLIIDSVAARSDANWDATHPPALQAFLESEYRFIGRFEFADIYRLKGR